MLREFARRADWTYTGSAVYLIERDGRVEYVGSAAHVGVRLFEHLCAGSEIGRLLKQGRDGSAAVSVRWAGVDRVNRFGVETQTIFAERPRLNSINPRWRHSPLLSLVPDRRAA